MSNQDPNHSSGMPQKAYRNLKKKLIHIERTNYDKIYVIPCSGGNNWFEVSDVSALLYFYKVCKKIDKKVKFYADDISFYEHYETGYIRLHGINKLRSDIKAAGFYKSETHLDNGLWVFQLNIKLKSHQIEKLAATEKQRRVRNITPIETNSLDPKLHQLLVSSATRLHQICNSRLNKLSSQTVGASMVNLIDQILIEYHEIAYMKDISDQRLREKLENMRKNIQTLLFHIQLAGEVRLWNLELCASVAEPVHEARNRIENNLKEVIRRSKKCNPST